MADVLAVADRVVVLRLGRNNGVYNVADVTSETLIAAITGAVDHSGARWTPPAATPVPSTAPGRVRPAPAADPSAADPAVPEEAPVDGDTGGTVIRMPRTGSRRLPREDGRR